jgi:hypothetical protein
MEVGRAMADDLPLLSNIIGFVSAFLLHFFIGGAHNGITAAF